MFACGKLSSLKGLSMSGLKITKHIRFHTLIFLVPTPNMFLYLSYVVLR